jgi:adenylate cyclase
MPFYITSNYQGTHAIHVFDTERLIIGRLAGQRVEGLDLGTDSRVSRSHALLEMKEGACWLSDQGSRWGTFVNGCDIRGQKECRLWPEDTIILGDTTLTVVYVTQGGAESLNAPLKASDSAPNVHIVQMLDALKPAPSGSGAVTAADGVRLRMLLDLPARLGAQTGRNELFQAIIGQVIAAIPAAQRGALLLHDPQQDTLLLKAYVAADEPAVSQTLARRALHERRGFIWRSGTSADVSQSMRQFNIASGMYAPVQWQDQMLGVICVDSPMSPDGFGEEDLRFLMAVGHYVAMVLGENQLRAEFQRQATLVDRLLANFSPSVRAVLVKQARLGKLRPGGTKSEVTILFCDICGFTKKAAQLDAHDVVEMLDHYFQQFVQTIFQYDGTVDKFVGDAVLAVFGSPEPDPQHHQKAVRAALALQEAVGTVTKIRAARGDPACQVRVGIHSGEVFHGFVGALDRLEFTVIGDAVNRATRYCSAAGEGEILISPDVFQRVFNLVKAEKTTIQTKEGDLAAFRLKGLKG